MPESDTRCRAEVWPVPESFEKDPPPTGSPGSFWEDRSDRRHCGVDIYAPFRARVLSVGDGLVVRTGMATSPSILPYWNETQQVLIHDDAGCVWRYAELDESAVRLGDRVYAGDLIGYVGRVLNAARIDDRAPGYIRRLKSRDDLCMLHFEVSLGRSHESEDYLGGNWIGEGRPPNLADPTRLLACIGHSRRGGLR